MHTAALFDPAQPVRDPAQNLHLREEANNFIRGYQRPIHLALCRDIPILSPNQLRGALNLREVHPDLTPQSE